MSQDGQNLGLPMRRGKVFYETNPSVSGRFPTRIVAQNKGRVGNAYMVAGQTGEVVGEGGFAFVEEKELDNESFVKVYLEGIKQYAQLSKSGATLFEFVYRSISGIAGKDKDTVGINYWLVQKWMPNISKRTFERGLAELLEKSFLFRSVITDTFFINCRFLFNGDRLALVKVYRRKGSPFQTELPLQPQTTVLDAQNVQLNDDSNKTEQRGEQ